MNFLRTAAATLTSDYAPAVLFMGAMFVMVVIVFVDYAARAFG